MQNKKLLMSSAVLLILIIVLTLYIWGKAVYLK